MLLLSLLVPAALASAKASHEGWPQINGVLKMHSADQSGVMRGRPTSTTSSWADTATTRSSRATPAT